MNVMSIPKFASEVAQYEAYDFPRYRGNPMVEALRLSTLFNGDLSKDGLLKRIEHMPIKPDRSVRLADELIRETELDALCEVVYARPAYRQAVPAILRTVMNAYARRVWCSVDAVALRYQLATLQPTDIFNDKHLNQSDRFVIGHRGTAGGFGVFGSTGSGKTTLVNAICELLGRVISHGSYNGHALDMLQIPVLHMSVPHDSTIRGFLLQFAAIVDHHLGEQLYEKQVRSLKTIADAALLMLRICASINLGALIVDDLQNLRAARGAGVDLALNLLALLIDFGTSVITLATPAVGNLLVTRTRNTRKLISNGYIELGMMAPGSAESRGFQDAHWNYQYTSKHTPISPKLRKAWEQAGAGNPAFSTLAYKLAQTHLIGEKDERITPELFDYVSHVDMAPLRPAIDALLSGDPFLLGQFDDLIFKEELRELFRKIKMEIPDAGGGEEPFDDEPDKRSATRVAPRKRNRPMTPVQRAKDLPVEDPLTLMSLH